MVSAFYPAVTNADEPFARMLDLLEPNVDEALRIIAQQPTLGTSGRIAESRSMLLRSRRDPPAATGNPPFPVLIYSPGGLSDRLSNAGICESLASQGFVIFTLDTPRDAPVVVFPDRRIVTPPLLEDESYIGPRVADIRHLMDALPTIDGLNLDPLNVSLLGHSRGGYVSVITAVLDHRVKAAVNMDGFFWGIWTKDGSTGLSQFPLEFQEQARACRTPILRLRGEQPSLEAARLSFELESADLAGPFTYAALTGWNHGSFVFPSSPSLPDTPEKRAADREQQHLLERTLLEFFNANSTSSLAAAPCARFERR
jgi:pimeloyl-ACP methyl ester carboxylesterase